MKISHPQLLTISLIKSYLQPYKANKIRLGSEFDGGYVVPNNSVVDADCLLTFGVSTNIDFEKDFNRLNPGASVFMLDPFIGPFNDFKRLIKRILKLKKPIIRNIQLKKNKNYKEKPKTLLKEIYTRMVHWMGFYLFISKNNVKFWGKGIAISTNKKFISFADYFRENNITRKKSVVLKIDIEGNEYPLFNEILNYIHNINVLLLELHDVSENEEIIETFIAGLKNKGLYLIHIHGNNTDICDENGLPNTLELTFTTSSYCDIDCLDSGDFPVKGLDAPCTPIYEDYPLIFKTSTIQSINF